MKAKRSLLGLVLVAACALAFAATWPVSRRDRVVEPSPNAPPSIAAVASVRLPGAATHAAQADPVPEAEANVKASETALDCGLGQGDAATVDGRPITAARVCDRMRFLTGTASPAVGRQVLDQLIEAELVAAALADRGLAVTDREIDAELAAPEADRAAARARSGAAIARSELRAATRERIGRRKLVDLLGALEPPGAELLVAAAQAERRTASVEAWIARLAGNASNEADAAARKVADSALEHLRSGADPEPKGLSRLPPFTLAQGSREPALEAVLLSAHPGDWQAPVRTRAGWVVARVTALQRMADRAAEQDDPRHVAVARLRQAEERRVLDELRAKAAIVISVR